MKRILRTFLILPSFALCISQAQSQECVDSSLIDLNAACPLIYAPVCGCNGVTYSNDCEAQVYGGVTSWIDGECAQGGCTDMGDLDFGACDMFLGYTWIDGTCAPMSGCGYTIGNIDYSPNFYSSAWSCQQTCGNPATDCTNQWQIEQGYLVDCAPIANLVCGCDGIEYLNGCFAYYYFGTTTYSNLPCAAGGCQVIPVSTQFGDCAMPLGWARLEQGCSILSGCSYIGQNGFDYEAYFFATEEDCIGNCANDTVCVDSSLIDLSVFCATVVDPVCGCNGLTYNNSCEAIYYGGVTEYTSGPCTTGLTTMKPALFSISPNPFENTFVLRTEGLRPSFAVVLDMTARVIETFEINQSSVQVNSSDWPSGTYVLQVHTKTGERMSVPIIKQ